MLSTVRTTLPHLRALQRSWEPVSVCASVQLQQVRWRKRRTDPKAKSKMDRVKTPTPRDPWEFAFVKEKLPHYKSTLKAIRRLFKEELDRKKDETAEGLSSVEVQREEDEEFRRLLLWNEEENAITAARRREKLALKAKEMEEEKLQRLLRKEEQEAEEVERLRELVLQEKEASKSFINLDNMDAAIEEALANPKNYNFLIKKSGEPILPDDTAWEKLKQKVAEAKDQELVDNGSEGDQNIVKSAENIS